MKGILAGLLILLFGSCNSGRYCNNSVELGQNTICIYLPPGFKSMVDSQPGINALSVYHNYSNSSNPSTNIAIHTVEFSKKKLDNSDFNYYHEARVKELAAMRTNFYRDTVTRINGNKWAYSCYVLKDTNYRSDAIFTIKDGSIYGVRIGNDNYQQKDSQKYQQYVDSILRSVVFRKPH